MLVSFSFVRLLAWDIGCWFYFFWIEIADEKVNLCFNCENSECSLHRNCTLKVQFRVQTALSECSFGCKLHSQSAVLAETALSECSFGRNCTFRVQFRCKLHFQSAVCTETALPTHRIWSIFFSKYFACNHLDKTQIYSQCLKKAAFNCLYK